MIRIKTSALALKYKGFAPVTSYPAASPRARVRAEGDGDEVTGAKAEPFWFYNKEEGLRNNLWAAYNTILISAKQFGAPWREIAPPLPQFARQPNLFCRG